MLEQIQESHKNSVNDSQYLNFTGSSLLGL